MTAKTDSGSRDPGRSDRLGGRLKLLFRNEALRFYFQAIAEERPVSFVIALVLGVIFRLGIVCLFVGTLRVLLGVFDMGGPKEVADDAGLVARVLALDLGIQSLLLVVGYTFVYSCGLAASLIVMKRSNEIAAKKLEELRSGDALQRKGIFDAVMTGLPNFARSGGDAMQLVMVLLLIWVAILYLSWPICVVMTIIGLAGVAIALTASKNQLRIRERFQDMRRDELNKYRSEDSDYHATQGFSQAKSLADIIAPKQNWVNGIGTGVSLGLVIVIIGKADGLLGQSVDKGLFLVLGLRYFFVYVRYLNSSLVALLNLRIHARAIRRING